MSPVLDAPSTQPDQVGSWRLSQLVCEGRLCRVYQAAPADGVSPHAAYAVKLLSPEWEDDASAVACMEREARIGREISHPHLISVLAAHTAAAPYYVVTPWLGGASLATHLKDQRELSSNAAFWIARQIAEALEALHQAGWMHNDVKPDNIFLSPQGHATLLDMGFAQRLEERPANDCGMIGTIAYMAPEKFDGGRAADIRSDIYSLGITLFEMLTGGVPFAGRNVGEIIRQHRGARADSIRRQLPTLPREAAALVADMLAKEPLRRPQSPRELIDQLVRLEISLLVE
jgi:serine/threonine-protein kinase